MMTHDLIREQAEMEDYVVFVANGNIKISRLLRRSNGAGSTAQD
jgi:hypothetical protein